MMGGTGDERLKTTWWVTGCWMSIQGIIIIKLGEYAALSSSPGKAHVSSLVFKVSRPPRTKSMANV